MDRIKLSVAMLHISRYFSPLTVSITLKTPITMDIQLTDPVSTETAKLLEIPCRSSMTAAELYQLINLIENQAKARNFELFHGHVVESFPPQ